MIKIRFCSESFLLFFQGDPLRTLPLSRGGSVESLPARTQCLASSDSKRMSADLSELEPKIPFTPAGNVRHYTVQNNIWKQSRIGAYRGKLACSMLYYDFLNFLFNKKSCTGEACSVIVEAILVGMRPFQVHKKLPSWHLSQVLLHVLSSLSGEDSSYRLITSICPLNTGNHLPSFKGSDRKQQIYQCCHGKIKPPPLKLPTQSSIWSEHRVCVRVFVVTLYVFRLKCNFNE